MTLYRANSEGPFTLNKDEVQSGLFISKKKLEDKVRDKEIELSFSAIKSLRTLGFKI
jgi:hypothetical protein